MGQNPLDATPSYPVITEPERCSGCGRCISACPQRLYVFETINNRKYAVNKNPADCNRCGRCIIACPLGIIR